ncbi:hypothetical protein LEN26_014360 [Aphanomyces euteiches]|nr:hypothetical protein LEN26_014360 [Aphanomyces euteiches]
MTNNTTILLSFIVKKQTADTMLRRALPILAFGLMVLGQVSSKNAVFCRQVTPTKTTAYLKDSACALNVLLVAPPTSPNETIEFYFEITRNAASTQGFQPSMVYEVPSNNKTQLADIDAGMIGIVPSNFDSTNPPGPNEVSFTANKSPLLRKNFSAPPTETLLDPKSPQLLAVDAGTYKVVAWFRFFNAASNTTDEYLTVLSSVVVKPDPATPTFPITTYDEHTTYCWSVDNTTAFDAIKYQDSFSSNCPVTMTITNPLTATNNAPFNMVWSMQVASGYTGPNVYALNYPDGSAPTIKHSSLHFCSNDDETKCHMFNPKQYVLSSDADNETNTFTNGIANFTSSGLNLTKGLYIGFAHGVVPKAPGSTSVLHVATYFELLVNEKVRATDPIVNQTVNTTYCWKVFAPACFRNVSAASAIGGNSVDTSCPLSLSLAPSGPFSTNAPITFNPIVSQPPTPDNVSALVSLPATYNISLATLTWCKTPTGCGPFKSQATAVDLVSKSALAYSPTTLQFPQSGEYFVYMTVSVDTGKGIRLDSSVLTTINVQDVVPATSHAAVYAGVAGGVCGVLLIGCLIWYCVNRRRKQRWERHRLQRGAMNYKENGMTRVRSVIPMVDQRGGISGVTPGLFDDEDTDPHNPKLDLAVSHYMYNPETRRVDEMPRKKSYDPRNEFQNHDDELHLGFEKYNQPQSQPRHNQDRRSARDDYTQHQHQLVIHNEYTRHQQRSDDVYNQGQMPRQQLALAAHAHDDDHPGILDSQNLSPSSLRNNYGYDLSSFTSDQHRDPYLR